MRLIKIDNIDNFYLSEHISEADLPPFAILSHTWASPEDEFAFQDMADISKYKHKSGFQKIRAFCEQAQQSGYNYA